MTITTPTTTLGGGTCRLMLASALASAALYSPVAAARGDDMAVYIACIVKASPEGARQLLDTSIGSADEEARARRIVSGHKRCLDDTDLATVETSALRGGIAEQLLVGDKARLAAIRAAAPSAAKTPAGAQGRGILASFGDCLAASKPEVALRLIRTRRGSHAEREALGAFGDTMKTCMPADTKYRLEIADVRNHVADALWRRSGGVVDATSGSSQ